MINIRFSKHYEKIIDSCPIIGVGIGIILGAVVNCL